MVGPEQQMLRTQHLVATGKRLLVIADGVNIKVGEIVADRAGEARRFGDERGRATIGFDAAFEIGQDSAGVRQRRWQAFSSVPGQFRIATSSDEDICAFVHEPLCRRQADATIASGHKRYFPIKLTHGLASSVPLPGTAGPYA